MSADVLRQAAALMRKRAQAAMGDRPEWFTETNGFGDTELWARRDAWDYQPQPVLDEHSQRKTPGSFAHFAALTPAVALAVADWLDTAGSDLWAHGPLCECGSGCHDCDDSLWQPHVRRALTVARVYLGVSA